MLSLSLAEFEEAFGKRTERREELHQRFKQWLDVAARSDGLRRLWVFGSFVTDKPGPGDLDLLAVFDAGFRVEALPAADKHWFDHEVCRELYEIDFFWLTQQATDQTLMLILDTFRTNRLGDEAMIEVML